MIPAAFSYHRATSVEDAARLLAQGGAMPRSSPAGHSLIPLMRLRLAQPSALVDINGLERELGYVRRDNGTLRVGALTRHYQIEASDEVKRSLPLLADIAREVGDAQVRSMGTIGGVMAHADPAGDYGTLALMLDATITTNKRVDSGARVLPRAVYDAAGGGRAGDRSVVPGARRDRTST